MGIIVFRYLMTITEHFFYAQHRIRNEGKVYSGIIMIDLIRGKTR